MRAWDAGRESGWVFLSGVWKGGRVSGEGNLLRACYGGVSEGGTGGGWREGKWEGAAWRLNLYRSPNSS